jgi:SEC-C motif-containing protein
MVPEAEPDDPCPCDGGLPLGRCCGSYISGRLTAPTAEALMRSRYTAYVLRNRDYLLATWDPLTRPKTLDLDADQRWLGLRILRTEGGTRQDDTGEVEFVARFKLAGQATRLHEHSRFRKAGDGWLYVDGTRGPTDSSLRS